MFSAAINSIPDLISITVFIFILFLFLFLFFFFCFIIRLFIFYFLFFSHSTNGTKEHKSSLQPPHPPIDGNIPTKCMKKRKTIISLITIITRIMIIVMIIPICIMRKRVTGLGDFEKKNYVQ